MVVAMVVVVVAAAAKKKVVAGAAVMITYGRRYFILVATFLGVFLGQHMSGEPWQKRFPLMNSGEAVPTPFRRKTPSVLPP